MMLLLNQRNAGEFERVEGIATWGTKSSATCEEFDASAIIDNRVVRHGAQRVT